MKIKICPYSGKVQYRTRKKALKAAARYKAKAMKRQEHKHAAYAYMCNNCMHWHLSKQKDRKK